MYYTHSYGEIRKSTILLWMVFDNVLMNFILFIIFYTMNPIFNYNILCNYIQYI